MHTSKFFFVWNPNRRSPSYKHATAQSATAEAERLARANRGESFIVLESLATVRVPDVVWELHREPEEGASDGASDDEDELPF